jgi:spermidine synthase
MTSDVPEVIERAAGRSGELLLRRRGGEVELLCDGTFLISSANERSSRALIAAAAPLLPDRPLDVLIGGLGLGYALDEALDLPTARTVTVAEYEPVVARWFGDHGGERATRAQRDARSRIVVADVHDLLAGRESAYDLVALDTDNGPDWLVRSENRRLYDPGGLLLVARTLRDGGVAAFWATGRDAAFAERLGRAFGGVTAHDVVDDVGGRELTFTMYVGSAPGPRR